jgi:hypothetical protein
VQPIRLLCKGVLPLLRFLKRLSFMGPRIDSWLCGGVRVDVAELIADLVILALVGVVLLMLSRTWMRRMVLSGWPCLVVLCFVHYQHPSWLDSVPGALVDCTTSGLATLGGYVALNPPSRKENVLKRLYFCFFVALAVIGVGANIWARSVEKAAGIRFSADLSDVKKLSKTASDASEASRAAIRDFVDHPPKGFTQGQVVSVVQQLLANQKAASAPPVSVNPYEYLTNDELVAAAKTVAAQINDDAIEWDRRTKQITLEYDEQIYQHSPPFPEPERNRLNMEKFEKVRLIDQGYATGDKALFVRADGLRGALIDHLVKKKGGQPPTDKIDATFKRVATSGPRESTELHGMSFRLLALCKELSP